MIRKTSVGVIFLLSMIASVYGQKSNAYYLELGGASSSFQDIKFSQVRYRGIGADFSFGFEKNTTQAIWGASLNILGAKEAPATHASGRVLTLMPTIKFAYVRALNDKLYLGGKWDILDFDYRNIQGLQNNGNYFAFSSSLFVSSLYKYKDFDFGIDLSLLSLLNEGTGFAFSSSQNVLENGRFDYQNEAINNPLSLRNCLDFSFYP